MTSSRQQITVQAYLRLDSPLHVGALRGDRAVDMRIVRNAAGALVLPGTSLKGVLRASYHRDDNELWGDAKENGAARITVHDSAFGFGGELAKLDVREGVSLSRFWGTAVDGLLFSREFVPASEHLRTSFEVRLPEGGHADGGCRCAACEIVDVLRAGLRVGAATSTGNGLVTLCGEPNIAVVTFDPSGMWELLTRPVQDLPVAHECPKRPAVPTGGGARVSTAIHWRARGPVMSKVAVTGGLVDAAPLARVMGNEVCLLLPGSSLKGSLRARAEWIIRSIAGLSSSDRDGFPVSARTAKGQLEYLNESARIGGSEASEGWGPVGLLFGAASFGRSAKGHKGAIIVRDCLSRSIADAGAWGELKGMAEASPPSDKKDRAKECGQLDAAARKMSLIMATRVAVDRWTGGALDGALFTSLDPYLTEEKDWGPLEIEVDTARLGPLRDASLGLLWLVLSDLADGEFGFGFGQTRGYGSIKVESALAAVWLPFTKASELMEPAALVEKLVDAIDRRTDGGAL